MTRNDSPRGTDDRSTARRGGSRVTRRDVVRAVGAGTGALAMGAGATGSGSAQQGDGPGQSIPTPKLETDGNLLVDPDGNTVTLRGLNVADPRRLNASAPMRGKDARQTIDYLTDTDLGWHPRVLRLPVHPGDIGGLTPVPEYNGVVHDPVAFTQDQLETYCEEHLDAAVQRCEERGVYAIVDFHRHWGPTDWTIPELDEEVRLFWDYVAERYGDRDHCIFEVYNEPQEPQVAGPFVDENGEVHEDWLTWRETCGGWVDVIRRHTDNLVIIGSPNYSQRPEGGVVAPFPHDNVGYTYHIYPEHNISKNQAWDEPDGANESVVAPDGTPIYEEAPLFVTEFGWEDPDLDTFYLVQGTEEDYGDPFLEFLESHPAIHWTAWCADPIWRSVMFSRGFLDEDPFDPVDVDSVSVNPYEEEVVQRCEETPCDWELLTREHGQFMGGAIRDHLAEFKDHNVPQTGSVLEPPATPSDLSTSEVAETSVSVTWSSVADADHYNVYRDDARVGEPTATSFTVEDLSPGTTYTIGVDAENDDGRSSRATIEVTTPGDALPEPSDLQATDVGTTTVQIEWTAVGDADHYNVLLDGAEVAEPTATSHTLQDLSPGTTYTVGVEAENGADTSATATIEATTSDGPLPEPSDLQATDVGTTTVQIEWAAVQSADHYDVLRDGETVAEPTETSHTFLDLDPDTEYAIGVQAETADSTSSTAGIVVTTLSQGCADAEDETVQVEGQTVCDVDRDGDYRDVDGDGEVGQSDVAEFFTKQHRSAWKRPELFDFTGNGDVTHGDVVELFDYVALN